MTGDLTDRTVVITGANGGIGTALTRYLLERGMTRLVLQYRRSPASLLPILESHSLDPEHHCYRADLSSERDARDFSRQVADAFGPVWGLINLAGSTSNGMSWKLSLDDFQQVISSNLTSTFLACREFIPAMRAAGNGGRIVNTSSVVALTGVAGASHYCAAKAGIMGFTRALSLELASSGITANALALGYFDYGMLYTVPADVREGIRQQIPAGRFGEAAEIGGMLMYLLSDEGAYTTGQVLEINGGLRG